MELLKPEFDFDDLKQKVCLRKMGKSKLDDFTNREIDRMSIPDLARLAGIKESTLRFRLRDMGLSRREAITRPVEVYES